MIREHFFLCCITILLAPNFFLFAQEPSLIVKLQKEVNFDIDFDEDLVDFQLNSLDKIKDYEQSILTTYKGIPKCDSLKVHIFNVDNDQFYYDIYKQKLFNKEKFLKLVRDWKIDTLLLSSKPVNQKLVVLIGFNKDTQFIIPDSNRNENFTDDIRYEYTGEMLKQSEGNLQKLEKLPLSSFNYEVFINGKLYNYNRMFIPYPYCNHLFSQKLEVIEKKYLSFVKFRNFWKGISVVNNKTYEFAVQATDRAYSVIYVKEKEILWSKVDKAYNRQFMHRIKDTVFLKNNSFVLDSLDNLISKLYITPLKNQSVNNGYKIGQTISNFTLFDLENNSFRLFDVSNKKKYTLIEFWGTWCGPCREIMPDIKKTADIFSSKLNIISIAFDKNAEIVRNFTHKHKMNWTNAFLDIKKEHEIINDLKIQIYPTFILLDSEGTIVWRGSSSSFNEIVKRLKMN